jgi:hypothetical protein
VASVIASVSWDPRYDAALTEAAWSVGVKPHPLCGSNCPATNFSLAGAGFEDPVKLKMVIEQARGLALKIEVQDSNGHALTRICQPLALLQEQSQAPNPMIIVGDRHVALNTQAKIWTNFNFYLGQNTAEMARLNEIRAEVVTQSQCQNM